jgi:type IV pilus assembly protein PilA
MSSTLVVSRAATPEELEAGLAPPRLSGGVIALGVLAGMVPVAGIVAAITIPAYQDYVIRSQVAEGLTLASSQKLAIAEAWAQTGEFEGIDSESLQLPVAGGKYVKSIEVIDSVIEITFSDEANQHLVGRAILLVPGHTEQGDIVWTCGLAPIPDGVTPALRAHTQYTDVDPKFMPSACRR